MQADKQSQKGRRRREIKTNLPIRIDLPTLATIDKHAEKLNGNRNEVVRRALALYLATQESAL